MNRVTSLKTQLFKECQKIVYYKFNNEDIKDIKQRLLPLVRKIELEELRRNGFAINE